MNTYVRDQIRHLGHHSTGGGPIARRTHNAAQNSFAQGGVVSFNTDVFTPVGFEAVGTSGASELISAASPQSGFFILGASLRAANTGSGSADLGITSLNDSGPPYIVRGSSVPQSATGAFHISTVTGFYTNAVADFNVILNHSFSNLDIASNSNSTPIAFWGVWVGQPV
ncbi:MAG TPA: hypothetical protein VMH39_03665 [Gemmatimonadaceae bacterium]|nr:hypothetical protein [Gemmatimonadaceae bacterium]